MLPRRSRMAFTRVVTLRWRLAPAPSTCWSSSCPSAAAAAAANLKRSLFVNSSLWGFCEDSVRILWESVGANWSCETHSSFGDSLRDSWDGVSPFDVLQVGRLVVVIQLLWIEIGHHGPEEGAQDAGVGLISSCATGAAAVPRIADRSVVARNGIDGWKRVKWRHRIRQFLPPKWNRFIEKLVATLLIGCFLNMNTGPIILAPAHLWGWRRIEWHPRVKLENHLLQPFVYQGRFESQSILPVILLRIRKNGHKWLPEEASRWHLWYRRGWCAGRCSSEFPDSALCASPRNRTSWKGRRQSPTCSYGRCAPATATDRDLSMCGTIDRCTAESSCPVKKDGCNDQSTSTIILISGG